MALGKGENCNVSYTSIIRKEKAQGKMMEVCKKKWCHEASRQTYYFRDLGMASSD